MKWVPTVTSDAARFVIGWLLFVTGVVAIAVLLTQGVPWT